MISFACNEDIPALKSLWIDTFTKDTEEQIDLFFEHRFKPSLTPVYKADEKIVSVLYLLDCSLRQGNGLIPALYIYAAATKREYQEQGIMSELLDFSKELALKNNCAAITLLPETPKLRSFYGKRGYKEHYKIDTIEFTRTELSALSVQNPCQSLSFDFDEYLKNRNELLSQNGSVIWNASAMKHKLKFYATMNPFFVRCEKSFGICYEENRRANLIEFIGIPADLPQIFSHMLRRYDVESFKIYLPHDFLKTEQIVEKNTVMILTLSDRLTLDCNAYGGLTMI